MAAQRDPRGPVDDKKGERGRTKKAPPRPLDRERVSPCRPAAQRAQRVSTSAESSGPESTSAGMRAKCAGGSMTTVSRRERRSPRTRSRSLRCWKERPRAPRPWGRAPPGARRPDTPDARRERRPPPGWRGRGRGWRAGASRAERGRRGRSPGQAPRLLQGQSQPRRGGWVREPRCGAPGVQTGGRRSRREQGRTGHASDWWPGRRGARRDPAVGGYGRAWISPSTWRPMAGACPCGEERPIRRGGAASQGRTRECLGRQCRDRRERALMRSKRRSLMNYPQE